MDEMLKAVCKAEPQLFLAWSHGYRGRMNSSRLPCLNGWASPLCRPALRIISLAPRPSFHSLGKVPTHALVPCAAGGPH